MANQESPSDECVCCCKYLIAGRGCRHDRLGVFVFGSPFTWRGPDASQSIDRRDRHRDLDLATDANVASMSDKAILEAIDHMLTMQASVLTSLAQVCVAVTTNTAAQDAMDEAEAHALWVQRWRERYIQPMDKDA